MKNTALDLEYRVFEGLPMTVPPRKTAWFVSGIDTDAGKSVASGWFARERLRAGARITTQKFIQTGAADESVDILLHRKIMGVPLGARDLDRTTAPVILPLAASPHLAAEAAGVEIPFHAIPEASAKLLAEFDELLIEGAGGLMVPLTRRTLTIDWLEASGLPLIFVTSMALGSISQTLLALEAVERRGIPLAGVLFNAWPEEVPIIREDSRAFVEGWLDRHFPKAFRLVVPVLDV